VPRTMVAQADIEKVVDICLVGGAGKSRTDAAEQLIGHYLIPVLERWDSKTES